MLGRWNRSIGMTCIALCAALMPTFAGSGGDAPERADQGPFSERNQFPFNLLFLAFPARGGSILAKGAREVLVVETAANSFAGSDVLVQFDTSQRVRLTPSVLGLAQSLEPGKSLFLVDTEQSRTSFTFRWGASDRFEADLEVPFLAYGGGWLDSAIEGYHRSGRFGNGGRDHFVQNAVQLALTLAGRTYFEDHSPARFRLSDVMLTGRFSLGESPRGSAAISVGLKLPTGSVEDLAGSGSMDEGVEVEGTVRWGRQRLHLIGGWVHVGTWDLFPEFNPTDLANFCAAYEYAHDGRISWIGQLQTQSSVFRNHPESDGYLADYSTEILAGARWRGASGRWSFQTAVIENIFDQNNGMDIGVLASFSVLFHAAHP